jgi:glucose-6-phosphate isomerase
LANVCPIDFQRAIEGLDPEETLIIIISKTFTTAETMLNARTCRHWLVDAYKQKNTDESGVKSMLSKHLCAVSTNLPETSKFGVDDNNVFGFWDWVGGRYSSWAAVGGVPLSLVFGYEAFSDFLKGGYSIDNHVINTKNIRDNIPVMLGLIGFYNTYIANIGTRAILPYCQALNKFANHIQQVDMESNGKSVSLNNKKLDYLCGPVVFGEPGTNGQHSFYQLIHQGRVIACEFIGYAKSQCEIKHEAVSNQDELMSNFFAQVIFYII